MTGYLTQDKVSNSGETMSLKIPNKEIKEIFETTVKKWFNDQTQLIDRKVLFAAVWNGDSKTLTAQISKLLRMTISYHDYKEDFYHTFLAEVFAGAGYNVQFNNEHGEGRSDIVIINEYEEVFCYGNSFYKKRCMVVM